MAQNSGILSRADDIKVGSERSFGIVFAVVFTVVGFWPLLNENDSRFWGEALNIWALIVALAFLLISLVRPKILKPLNLIWFKFGLLLHKVVNPLVMGVIFFFVVTPIALLMRIFAKRPLDRDFDVNAESYWIDRSPPGPAPETMKNQF